MADEAKTLDHLWAGLIELQTCLDGIVDASIPKIENPWKTFSKTNQELNDCTKAMCKALQKGKGVEGKLQEEFLAAKKKWENGPGVYGGLQTVMDQCKTAMEIFKQVEKDLDKL